MNTTLVADVAIITTGALYVIKRATDLIESLVADARTRRLWAATPSSSAAVGVGESPAPAAESMPARADLPGLRSDPVTGMRVRPDGSNKALDRIRAANGAA